MDRPFFDSLAENLIHKVKPILQPTSSNATRPLFRGRYRSSSLFWRSDVVRFRSAGFCAELSFSWNARILQVRKALHQAARRSEAFVADRFAHCGHYPGSYTWTLDKRKVVMNNLLPFAFPKGYVNLLRNAIPAAQPVSFCQTLTNATEAGTGSTQQFAQSFGSMPLRNSEINAVSTPGAYNRRFVHVCYLAFTVAAILDPKGGFSWS